MVLWNFDLLWKNYGSMEKTVVLWKKYMVPWIKLCYYRQNYGTRPKTTELQFTNGKKRKIAENDENFIYNSKNMVLYQNNCSFRTN